MVIRRRETPKQDDGDLGQNERKVNLLWSRKSYQGERNPKKKNSRRRPKLNTRWSRARRRRLSTRSGSNEQTVQTFLESQAKKNGSAWHGKKKKGGP